jgi:hypothetical protein
MPDPTVQFGEVHVSLANGRGHEHRAANISRLTFDHVQRLMAAGGASLRPGAVDHLRVGPVPVSLADMDDNEVARASAAEVYRAVLRAL